MSEILHNTHQEFWRPPVAAEIAGHSAMAGVCDDCGTEFMAGSGFCHVCGTARQAHEGSGGSTSLALRREFQHVAKWLGLSTAPLIAFFAGLGCLVAALSVGAIYTTRNFSDFQAIQLWRVQWLLAAVAAFVAGVLLKKAGAIEKNKY